MAYVLMQRKNTICKKVSIFQAKITAMRKQRGVKELEMLAELQIFGHVTAEFVFGKSEEMSLFGQFQIIKKGQVKRFYFILFGIKNILPGKWHNQIIWKWNSNSQQGGRGVEIDPLVLF